MTSLVHVRLLSWYNTYNKVRNPKNKHTYPDSSGPWASCSSCAHEPRAPPQKVPAWSGSRASRATPALSAAGGEWGIMWGLNPRLYTSVGHSMGSDGIMMWGSNPLPYRIVEIFEGIRWLNDVRIEPTTISYSRDIRGDTLWSFIMYPLHSRVDRVNLVLIHSVLHSPQNFGGIASWVAELHATGSNPQSVA